MSASERRVYYRLPIRVPIFLKGVDRNGRDFLELTHTVNVSASGACFLTKRELQISSDILLSIPAPVDLHSLPEEGYEFRFPAKIIRVEGGGLSARVAVQFSKLLNGNA